MDNLSSFLKRMIRKQFPFARKPVQIFLTGQQIETIHFQKASADKSLDPTRENVVDIQIQVERK